MTNYAEPGQDILDLDDIIMLRDDLLGQAEDNPLDEDEAEVLQEIMDLEAQLWTNIEEVAKHDTLMVEIDYWGDYCQDLAADIGYVNDGDNPLWAFIDWPAWAEACAQDYYSVKYGGHSYFLRS